MSKKENQKSRDLLVVGKEYFEDILNKRIIIGQEIYDRVIQTTRQLEQARQDFDDWDDFNSELLKQSFDSPKSQYKDDYDEVNNIFMIRSTYSQAEELREFKEDVINKVNTLKRLVGKLPLIKLADGLKIISTNATSSDNNKVFIVHGHNNEIKLDVARTLEKLGLHPIILHEQANSGRTIIEKFEEHSDVGFAVVLLTDDDLGKTKKDELLNTRARQNVILELGYFIAKLSRERVCPLYTKGVELPSDLSGVLYVELDKSSNWKIKLAKELKATGYNIDVNKII
jgi:predicted nucleotide-binding protein